MKIIIALVGLLAVLGGCLSPKAKVRDIQASAVSLVSPQAQAGGTIEQKAGLNNDVNLPIAPKAGRDQKGLEITSEGGVGMMYVALGGFAALAIVVKSAFVVIVKIVEIIFHEN